MRKSYTSFLLITFLGIQKNLHSLATENILLNHKITNLKKYATSNVQNLWGAPHKKMQDSREDMGKFHPKNWNQPPKAKLLNPQKMDPMGIFSYKTTKLHQAGRTRYEAPAACQVTFGRLTRCGQGCRFVWGKIRSRI